MSMVNPSIDKLATMVDSKYTLALKEVGEKKITYTRKK